ncbi:hypothetical protein NM208_g10083 [Fusarium decemcellulare]|uniref:Uncharacterized protein n=1 Tax=Fusarium decemcellulare TaxID=57161 RepID=A0ACC1RZD1_9HYPO|nr:hypothetical protein NM208_g10083 [Fusarium decemcellulare]
MGSKRSADDVKNYFPPTIIQNMNHSMSASKEELFSLVVIIHGFDDEADLVHMANDSDFSNEQEVIDLANDSSHGLAAAVHIKDYEGALRVTGQLQAGTTWVNMYNFVHYSIPFGGYKESGLGMECGEAVLENYAETKAVYFNMGMPVPQ